MVGENTAANRCSALLRRWYFAPVTTPAPPMFAAPTTAKVLAATSRAYPVLTLALVLGAVVSAGCRRPVDECQTTDSGDALAKGNACQKQYEATKDPETGLAAVEAFARGKNPAAALALAERLRGTSAEPRVLHTMAALQEAAGDKAAPDTFRRAAVALSAAGDFGRASQAARSASRLLWNGARYHEALVAADEALVAADKGKDPALQAAAYLGLGLILYDLGDLTGAEGALGEAEARRQHLEPRVLAMLAFNRGLLEHAAGHVKTARAAFEEFLRLPGMADSPPRAWPARTNLLKLAIAQGDRVWADSEHAEAQKLFAASPVINGRRESQVIWALRSAQVERLRQHPAAALVWLEKAQAAQPTPEHAWEIHHERGLAERALGNHQPAVLAFEQAIASIEGLRGEQYDDFKSWVVEQRRAPYEALFALHAQRGTTGAAIEVLERLQGRTFIEAFAAAASGGSPQTKSKEAGARDLTLRRLYPALRRSPLLATPPLGSAQLLQRLAGDNVVAYFQRDDQLHIVALRNGKAKLLSSRTTLGALQTLVTKVRQDVTDVVAAEQLGAALFPPGSLPSKGRLVVIPSSSLGAVPLAALRVGGKFLVSAHELVLAPSLNALVAMRQARTPPTTGATVFANAQGDLPEAEREAADVAAHLGPETRVFSGKQVTTAQLRQAQRARVLHLAVHSGIGAEGAWLGLADGRVVAGQLLEWGVGANLVVLASCASAVTRDPGQWGSLAAAFLAAGSPMVLGSLWSTEDGLNRRFVRAFYAEGGADDPVGALARVQRAFIAAKEPVNAWAPFVAFGAAPTKEMR